MFFKGKHRKSEKRFERNNAAKGLQSNEKNVFYANLKKDILNRIKIKHLYQ